MAKVGATKVELKALADFYDVDAKVKREKGEKFMVLAGRADALTKDVTGDGAPCEKVKK